MQPGTLASPDVLPPMVACIKRRLVKTAGMGIETFPVLAETAKRFNDTSWFWTDDNEGRGTAVRAVAVRRRPRHRRGRHRLRAPHVGGRRHPAPPRPAGAARAVHRPRAFRVETAFFMLEGDLSPGVVRHSLRFDDGRRTVAAAQHTGNTVAMPALRLLRQKARPLGQARCTCTDHRCKLDDVLDSTSRRPSMFRNAFRSRAAGEQLPRPEQSEPPDGALFDIGFLRTGCRHENEAAIRRLCRTVRLSHDTILCRALGRYKMYVDPTDEGLSPHLMLDGIWELWITEAVLGFVRAGMVAVDVGANLGYYTLLLADLVGAEGRVHAAEPNPRMMSYLHRSLQVNGFQNRVSLHAAALAGRSGEQVTLHIPKGLPQNASMMVAGEDCDSHTLATTTLDDIVGDGPVDFIKIDAEGAEQAIWQGMRRVLARRRPLVVFIEFTPDRYADPAAFLREMLETGFALSIIDPLDGVKPTEADAVLAGPGSHDRMLILAR